MIGSEYLFEGYSDPHSFIQQGPILGKGFPYPSIEAYIALYKFYGKDWLSSALRDYVTYVGPVKYKKHGEEIARKWFLGTQAYFLEQEFQIEKYAPNLGATTFEADASSTREEILKKANFQSAGE